MRTKSKEFPAGVSVANLQATTSRDLELVFLTSMGLQVLNTKSNRVCIVDAIAL